MYTKPVCHCGNELVIIEQHVHEIIKKINAAGIPGSSGKMGFYKNHSEMKLRCMKCGNLYRPKRDQFNHLIRGRKMKYTPRRTPQL